MIAEEPIVTGPPVPTNESPVGAVTRAIAWIIDVVLINLVATITGVGAALVLSVFPVAKGDQTAIKVIGAAVYGLWCIAYFVVFWAATGQSPGARVMQIRLLAASGKQVRLIRALVRFIGMELAIIPLFAGYAPLLFGRRALPDWLARTVVLDAPQTSLFRARQESLRRRRPSP